MPAGEYTVDLDRLDTAFAVIETARDGEEHLTDGERGMLNEAHAILQEWDDRRFGFYHDQDGGHL